MSSISIEQTDIGVDDWIDGASFVQAKVEIHRDPALWADLGPLYAQIDAAEQRLTVLQAAAAQPRDARVETSLGDTSPTASRAPAGEESLGEAAQVPQTVAQAQADLDALIGQAEELYARYDANKEVWTIRALEQEEIQAITEAVRTEVGHGEPPKRRAKEAAKSHATRTQAWTQVMVDQVKPEVDARALALAVVGVNVAGDEKPAPSVDGIKRLRRRPHGEQHFAKLLSALEAITLQEVAIPAPHRRGA